MTSSTKNTSLLIAGEHVTIIFQSGINVSRHSLQIYFNLFLPLALRRLISLYLYVA
jgi:hypothetical protein